MNITYLGDIIGARRKVYIKGKKYDDNIINNKRSSFLWFKIKFLKFLIKSTENIIKKIPPKIFDPKNERKW